MERNTSQNLLSRKWTGRFSRMPPCLVVNSSTPKGMPSSREMDPAIPTTLGTEYLLQQINQHESKLQEALDEKGRKRLRELESLLSQRLYDYVEDRFLWGYRIGVRTILECKD